MFNTRTVNGGKGKGYSYTIGQSVNGVNGVVIYPDDYNGTQYASSDWDTFEASGCVFLPVVGNRNGTSLNNVGSTGYYYSSTSSSTNNAYYVCVVPMASLVSFEYMFFRSCGQSVRLVHPVE